MCSNTRLQLRSCAIRVYRSGVTAPRDCQLSPKTLPRGEAYGTCADTAAAKMSGCIVAEKDRRLGAVGDLEHGYVCLMCVLDVCVGCVYIGCLCWMCVWDVCTGIELVCVVVLAEEEQHQ